MVRKNAVTPQHLDLTWGDSCGPDQNDFAVYEGTIDQRQLELRG